MYIYKYITSCNWIAWYGNALADSTLTPTRVLWCYRSVPCRSGVVAVASAFNLLRSLVATTRFSQFTSTFFYSSSVSNLKYFMREVESKVHSFIIRH